MKEKQKTVAELLLKIVWEKLFSQKGDDKRILEDEEERKGNGIFRNIVASNRLAFSHAASFFFWWFK